MKRTRSRNNKSRKTFHIPRSNAMFVLKINNDRIRSLKKENKRLEKIISSDKYQLMDTRGLKWQIQKYKDEINQLSRENRVIRSLLSKGKCVYGGDTYILK